MAGLKFNGIGQGTTSSRSPAPKPAPADTARQQPAIKRPPSSPPLETRIRISHGRRLPDQYGVRRDVLIACTSGGARLECELHQSAPHCAYMAYSKDALFPLISPIEEGRALLAAARRDLPSLFVWR